MHGDDNIATLSQHYYKEENCAYEFLLLNQLHKQLEIEADASITVIVILINCNSNSVSKTDKGGKLIYSFHKSSIPRNRKCKSNEKVDDIMYISEKTIH